MPWIIGVLLAVILAMGIGTLVRKLSPVRSVEHSGQPDALLVMLGVAVVVAVSIVRLADDGPSDLIIVLDVIAFLAVIGWIVWRAD